MISRPKIKAYDPSVAYRYAHLKRDGIWVTLKSTAGTVNFIPGYAAEAWTRKPTNITNQLWSHDVFDAFLCKANGERTLYCELFANNGEPASAVKHYLAEKSLDLLNIEAFASPDFEAGLSLSLLQHDAETLGVPFAPWVEGLWPSWKTDCPHAEGLVYKNGNLLNWAKEKAVCTIDCVVTDTKDGAGKYLGLVGALECSVEGKVVAWAGGMTDADRVEMSENDPQGRVCEVLFQYVGAKGRLRHPRFVQWRDDKRPDECTLDQCPELEAYYEATH